MRLLLVDGSTINVSAYTKGVQTVDGASVPSVSFTVTGYKLDDVKKMMRGVDCITMHLYNDANEEVEHFIGYQTRVSTALGMDDDSFIITMAKSSDTLDRLNAAEILVKSLSDKFDEYRAFVDEMITSNKSLADTCTETIQKYAEVKDQAATIHENYLRVIDDSNAQAGTVLTINRDYEKIVADYQAIVATVGEIKSLYAVINDSVKDALTSTSECSVNVSNFSNNIIKQNAAIEELQTKMTDINQTLINDSESVAIIKSNVEAKEKAYEDMSKRIGTVEDVNATINQKITEVNRLAEGTSTDLTNLSDRVDVTSKGVNSVKESVAAINNEMRSQKGDFDALKKNVDSVSETIKTNSDISEKMFNDVENKQKDVSRRLEEVGESVSKTSDAVSDIQSTIATIGDDINNIDDRVSVLEPVTDYTTLSLDEARSYRITESQTALNEYLATHPISSTCHKGIPAYYSITKEKQSYLQSMILTAQMAAEAGQEYKPSWNASGEVCTYDWTIAELQQLAFEIAAVVRPLVTKQQKIENQIKSAGSMETLKSINISYEN